ncbi:MAG: signal peptidase II [Clostridia bacterium]|nr:signal peptidase II [Clostridia bacterium]
MQNHSRSVKDESVIAVNVKKAALYIGVLLLVVLLDQITKLIVINNFQYGESKPLIEGVLHFTYILNEGAAFGMLADHRWIFIVLSTVAVLGIGAYLVLRSKKIGTLWGIALAMVVGGGVGNMIDRLWNGETFGSGAVIDFIDFRAFPNLWSWIFNIADAAVCIGAGLIVLAVILDEVKEARRKKAEKSPATTVETSDPAPSEEERHD